VANGWGSLVSSQRYLPYGLPRLAPGIGETDFSFTGQRGLSAVGLMDYKARFFNPGVGQFASPDVIVPGYTKSSSLNRFIYVDNNPIKYTDPSGHYICEDPGGLCRPPDGLTPNITRVSEASLNAHGRINPVSNLELTGPGYDFGEVQDCNLPRSQCIHPGIDVHGGYATVVAPGSGNVFFLQDVNQQTGDLIWFGNYIVFQMTGPNGTFIYHIFAHLENFNQYGLEQGEYVRAGTKIGAIGSSGNSTGKHLHWEIRVDPTGNLYRMVADVSGKLIFKPNITEGTFFRSSDFYYPREPKILNEYWINPWTWANIPWDTPYLPFAP
jgi:RHS repeat-associated protein